MPRHFDKRMTRLATEPLLPRHEGQPWCVCVCVLLLLLLLGLCCWVLVLVFVCCCVLMCIVVCGCVWLRTVACCRVWLCAVVRCCVLLCVVVCRVPCVVCCVFHISPSSAHLSLQWKRRCSVSLQTARRLQGRPHAAGTNTGKPSAAAVQRPLHSRMPPVRTHVTVVLARFLGWRPHLPTAESGGSADDGPSGLPKVHRRYAHRYPWSYGLREGCKATRSPVRSPYKSLRKLKSETPAMGQ